MEGKTWEREAGKKRGGGTGEIHEGERHRDETWEILSTMSLPVCPHLYTAYAAITNSIAG